MKILLYLSFFIILPLTAAAEPKKAQVELPSTIVGGNGMTMDALKGKIVKFIFFEKG